MVNKEDVPDQTMILSHVQSDVYNTNIYRFSN